MKALKNQSSRENWYDWKWQLKNAITSIEEVEKLLKTDFSKEFGEDYRDKLEKTVDIFPLSITPYYFSLIDQKDFINDPVLRQAFPDVRELDICSSDIEDPLGEDKDSPVEGLTHRYPDRVLFHVSNRCAMYCRHCTRKRKVGDTDYCPSLKDYESGIAYIEEHKEVRDVLLSGGDPFLLPDELIESLLERLSSIKHVEVIRIGTRTPVVLPYRITETLVNILKKHKNLWINTHYNHPKELTKDSIKAIDKLVEAGIPLGNQSVLLSDINDCPQVMKALVRKLVANRIRPYYLYQCDLSEGLEHFRTSVGRGIEIMESLRGHTSGFAIPTYVIDAPGGGGKIPIMPNYLISWSTNKIILRNYEGVITTYTEPRDYGHRDCDLNCADCNLHMKTSLDSPYEATGIEQLLSDYTDVMTFMPEDVKA
ncbi:lysine 2,3-aminomutase [Petrocella sp. FN5]|uniref:lysine 2,3-aminomutase n=1 Tax=Petrocella sp. FN5 TaxID=3032002 RepID=UPI0023DAAEC7|nr:lysine 2,3-aminomutase [Petrocella sp. FN5]MDF1617191.1 lysine 2,3-aminomutase [Petrocella sp. FN5]